MLGHLDRVGEGSQGGDAELNSGMVGGICHRDMAVSFETRNVSFLMLSILRDDLTNLMMAPIYSKKGLFDRNFTVYYQFFFRLANFTG